MKYIYLFLALMILSCSNSPIKKPENLIDKDIMVNVLYDLSIIESLRNTGYSGGFQPMEANNYILKKYKIDSLQFAQSNKYYASDVKNYKKMFETVNDRLTQKNTELTKKIIEKTGKQVAPSSNDL